MRGERHECQPVLSSPDRGSAVSVTPHLLGYPRIGPNRELKWALEGRWSGKTPRDEFEARIEQLKRDHLDEQRRLVGAQPTTTSSTTRLWRR